MKRFVFILTLCVMLYALCGTLALASPFIVSDVYPVGDVQPSVFEMILDNAPSVDVAPTNLTLPTGIGTYFKYDLVGMVGSHSVQVRACIPDVSTTPPGRACSDYSPFAFTITVPPKAPILRLQK